MIIRYKIDPKQTSSLFVQLYKFIHYYKMDRKNIADANKLVKKLVQYLLKWVTDKHFCQNHKQIRRRESVRFFNDKKLSNKKQIRKLLLTITVADPERFIAKNKLITYIEVFVNLYNWKNHR